MALAELPRRAVPDRGEATRARLAEVGRRTGPVVLARERALTVPGELGALLPGGVLRRGTTVSVEGWFGAGATSLALALAAVATTTGEWAGALDLDGTLGGEAAAAAGVALERFVVVRPPCDRESRGRWATTVAALLEGVTLVLAEVPREVRLGDARRLVARARERGAVLVALPVPGARWPADAALRLRATGGAWSGLGAGSGLLAGRAQAVQVEGQGEAARPRHGVLARAG